MAIKQCRLCKHFKPGSSFFKNGFRRLDGTSKTRNECKSCNTKAHAEYVEKNRSTINEQMRKRYRGKPGEKERMQWYSRQKFYGVSKENFEKMFKTQKGCCAICKIAQSSTKHTFNIDHDHDTGKIRGLLCMRCNRGMGLLRDDKVILSNALKYLKKNKN